MTAFDQAWALMKARTLEEIEFYEAGICPVCRGAGEEAYTVPTWIDEYQLPDDSRFGDFHPDDYEPPEIAQKRREREAKGNTIKLMDCISCKGTGKVNEEHWGDDGIHELNEEWIGLPRWKGAEQ